MSDWNSPAVEALDKENGKLRAALEAAQARIAELEQTIDRADEHTEGLMERIEAALAIVAWGKTRHPHHEAWPLIVKALRGGSDE